MFSVLPAASQDAASSASLSASPRIPRRPRGPGPGPGPAGPPSPPSATTSSPDPGRRPARLPQGCPLRPRCAFLTDCRETKLVTFPSATCDPAPRKGLLPRLTSVPRSPPLALGDSLFRWKLRHRPRLQDPPLLPPRASLRSPPFPPPSRLPSLLCPALRLSLGWSQFCSPGCVGSRWHQTLSIKQPVPRWGSSTSGRLFLCVQNTWPPFARPLLSGDGQDQRATLLLRGSPWYGRRSRQAALPTRPPDPTSSLSLSLKTSWCRGPNAHRAAQPPSLLCLFG